MESKKNETKTINDQSQIMKLRTAMFDQLDRLADPNVDLEKELKRANAITSVGAVIVNSVRVENDFMRLSKDPAKNDQKQLGNGK